MSIEKANPAELARRLGARRDRHGARPEPRSSGEASRSPGEAWRRETFTLSREEAREAARTFFERFPKAAYSTEIESWRELADGKIEFTMRRLPTAD